MILVLNAGSSSLKFAVFDDGNRRLAAGQVSGLGSRPRFAATMSGGPGENLDAAEVADHGAALRLVLRWLSDKGIALSRLTAAGHRIVHGGTLYAQPVVVDDTVLDVLDRLRALAPLHLPFGLAALHMMREAAPSLPQIACFDTAFHATQPDMAVRLPLPRAYHERGYRRYGFHGLNYEHVVNALPRQTGAALPRRLLAAHLGSGASMCAILDGKSIATTMGYSTADGLVMGTRTGAIDPGVLIALQRDDGMALDGVEDLLYRRSGLLGLSGITGDMRLLLESKEPHAREAVEYYCYWAARQAAGLISAMGGFDAVVFTAGVGENAAFVRQRIVDHLAWLGLSLDASRNEADARELSPEGGAIGVHVVAADEEMTIVRHAREIVVGTMSGR